MAFTSVTLTGSFANRADGTPARGYVSFQLSAALINGTTITPARVEKVHLTAGAFSIALPATNDVGTTPTGATYTVVEHIDGSENTYSIELVYTDTTQDLADIAPTEAGTVTYGVSTATFNAHLTDTVDAHDASAISYVGGTGMSATDVETAIDELATEKANSADAILQSIIDAAGDLIVGTAADTAARLAKGTALQVLRVNAGATALEWAAPGGAVGDLLDIQWVRKTADESVTSSTTFQDDDHLSLAVGANEIWEIEVWLRCLSAVADTPDIKIAFTGPAASTMTFGGMGEDTSSTNQIGTGYWGNIIGYEGTNWLTYGLVNDAFTGILLKGLYVGGANAGTLQLRWAQNTSSADAITVCTNSFLKGYRWA